MRLHKFKSAFCNFGNGLLLAAISTAAVSAQPYAYVANVSGFTVSVVNTRNDGVVASISVPGPSGLAVTQDGSSVYVASLSANSVAVIGAASNSVVATIGGVGLAPAALAISPNGSQVYVVSQGSSQISVIDTASRSVVASIPVGLRPTSVAFSPDGSRAFVTNLWSGTVSVIDTNSKAVVATFNADSGPNAAVVSLNGRSLYVTNEYSGTVTVHDTSSGILQATIPGFFFPSSIALTPDGSKAYVTNTNGSSVSVINTASNTVIASTGVGTFPTSVAISPDGSRAYVTNEYSFSVSVIDTASNSVVDTIARIGLYPYAVALAPAARQILPPPPPTTCSSSINPGSASFNWTGGTGSVAVASNCAWTASSNTDWIQITSGQSGNGNGTVTFNVSPNAGTSAVSGTLTIAGQTFTVNVAGLACSYSLSVGSILIASGGGTGSVNLNTQSGCGWNAYSDSSWLTISSGASGNGPGTVKFSAAPNNSSAFQFGTLTIGGQKFTVSQSGSGFAAIRISAGGTVNLTDPNGNIWLADSQQGNRAETTSAIAGTNFPALYQKESWSTGTLQYQFPVPNSSYTVKLHFAEFYLNVAQRGQRLFNIVINGTTVFSGFEILAQVQPNNAFDLTFPVTVSNGKVTIQLVPITGSPKLSGIQIY